MDNTLTKSELIAAMAMQGLLTKYSMNSPGDQIVICQMAVQLSNELLNQLSLSKDALPPRVQIDLSSGPEAC